MSMFIFRTPEGHDVAIHEEDIVMIWAAKIPGNTLIELIEDRPDIEVVCDFNTLLSECYDRLDLRLKAEQKVEPKPAPAPLRVC